VFARDALGNGNFWAKGVSVSQPQFQYGEMELAAAAGVAVKHFQRARQKNLRQGADWDLVHLHVSYTKTGAGEVLRLVLGDDKCPAGFLDRITPESGQKTGALETDGIVKRFFMNPHLVAVQLPGNAVVNIRVKSTANLRVGMIVPVREAGPGRYELAKKLPRYPGRW
jgi:hypothetical protein